jgi:hypothetical protein
MDEGPPNFSDNGVLGVRDRAEDRAVRDHFVRIVQHVPGVLDAIRKANPSDTFRVVMSKENVDLFKRGADGLYKPFLRRDGKFVENVSLVENTADYVGAFTNLVFVINMATIAADLQAIRMAVADIKQLLANTTRGAVDGAVTALQEARDLHNPAERRHHMLDACRNLTVRIHALAGQLRANVAAMPDERTGFFDGFFGSGIEDAKGKYAEVELDIWTLKEGCAALLRGYAELGEMNAARTALSRVVQQIGLVTLDDAARKARLIPMPKEGLAPEDVPRRFKDAILDIEARLLTGNAIFVREVVMETKADELTHEQ